MDFIDYKMQKLQKNGSVLGTGNRDNINTGRDAGMSCLKRDCPGQTGTYVKPTYDMTRYLGFMISLTEETCVAKFSKENLDHSDWTPYGDIQVVERRYAFYGPIQLTGKALLSL